jgi:hypothetical protein
MFLSLPANALADPRPYPHYHQYYEPATPSYEPQPYVSEHFTLTVRLILKDTDDRYSMPDFWVYAGGKEKLLRGTEFEDDAKAKVTFVLDRERLDYEETVQILSLDSRYDDTTTVIVGNYNERTINWKLG